VNRRLLTILLPLALASLASGCTTFSDNDAIARVGDVELSDDTLADFQLLVGGPDADANDPELMRAAIGTWSQVQTLSQLAGASDVATPAEVAEASELQAEGQPGYSDLQVSTQTLIVDYFNAIDALPELTPPEEEIAAWFDRGPATAGLACVSHILVETKGEADEIVDELESGADFATLASERSVDAASGANGGFLSCTSTDEIATQFVAEFADAALVARPGIPTEPVQSEFGFHIIRNGTFDEHTAELAPLIAQGSFAAQMAIDEADVYVNPRYGTFDPTTGGVIPLG
jgi:PPIC-type PPIASE domain